MEKIKVVGKGPKALKLEDGRFVGVKRPVSMDQFERGGTYSVTIETKTTNGRSFHDIVEVSGAETSKPVPKAAPKSEEGSGSAAGGYKARDFDAEARGKTRCAMYEAALQSPVVANLVLSVNGLDKALEVVKQAADAGFEYVFPKESK